MNLKSSMERFIVQEVLQMAKEFANLKSSMERFIAESPLRDMVQTVSFKIQYGEIYSGNMKGYAYILEDLKSSMERFIGGGFFGLYIEMKI